MTDDARNSLIALISVTGLIAASCLFLWLVRDVEIPGWVNYAVLGLLLLNLLIAAFRWLRKRSMTVKKRTA